MIQLIGDVMRIAAAARKLRRMNKGQRKALVHSMLGLVVQQIEQIAEQQEAAADDAEESNHGA